MGVASGETPKNEEVDNSYFKNDPNRTNKGISYFKIAQAVDNIMCYDTVSKLQLFPVSPNLQLGGVGIGQGLQQ